VKQAEPHRVPHIVNNKLSKGLRIVQSDCNTRRRIRHLPPAPRLRASCRQSKGRTRNLIAFESLVAKVYQPLLGRVNHFSSAWFKCNRILSHRSHQVRPYGAPVFVHLFDPTNAPTCQESQRAFCFTVKVFPAISMVPMRASLLLLTDTE
jgi:hypothetical protein